MLFVLALIAASYTFGQAADPPTWSQSGCGQSKYADAGEMYLPAKKQIVGGIDAREHEFPWQVSIRDTVTGRHQCGGIIINERWILTAAHCMQDTVAGLTSIVAGEHDMSKSDVDAPARQYLDADQIIINPDYNPDTLKNDVALISTVQSIQLSPDVAAVCAPDPDLTYAYYKSQVSGWGAQEYGGSNSDILQYVTLNITTNAFCASEYMYNNAEYITDGNICASDNHGGFDRDACVGDSGGPLTIKESDGTFRVVGTVSWGIGCADGFPGVYSRVTTNADWITTTIGA